MSEQQAKVLEMVAAGTISVDEGTRLLEALEPVRSSAAEQAFSFPPTPPIPPVPPVPPIPPVPPVAPHAPRARTSAGGFTFEQLAQLATLGVDADFVRRFREAGIEDLGFDHLAHLGAVRADPTDFQHLRVQMEEAGLPADFNEVLHALLLKVDVDKVTELIHALGSDEQGADRTATVVKKVKKTVSRDEAGGEHEEVHIQIDDED
jgi:hypothetical protein